MQASRRASIEAGLDRRGWLGDECRQAPAAALDALTAGHRARTSRRCARRAPVAPGWTTRRYSARGRSELRGTRARPARGRPLLGLYGRLAIGFTGSCTYALLPALAAALRHELPGVVLDLRGELLTPAQVTRLVDGDLDLGLLRPPVNERGLSTEVLRSEPLLAVLPESAPGSRGRGDPARATRRRAVRHVSVALQVRGPRRRRGRLCGARLRADRRARGGRDLDARKLRRGRPRVPHVPASVRNMTVQGAVYRPLAHDTTRVELAAAWRPDDDRPALARALDVIRRDLRTA